MNNGSKGNGVRCAIYTRKSTEEGLEQEFNSLDAQREAAEAYISSQRNVEPCALLGAGGEQEKVRDWLGGRT